MNTNESHLPLIGGNVFCVAGLSCWEYSHTEAGIFWASGRNNVKKYCLGRGPGCEKTRVKKFTVEGAIEII